MKYDAIRSVRELRQGADMAVVATLGWLASTTFGLSPWLTVLAALVIYRPLQQQSEGMLWRRPSIQCAFLALIALSLISNWSDYQQGVYAGYDAASAAAQR